MKIALIASHATRRNLTRWPLAVRLIEKGSLVAVTIVR